MHNNMHLMGSRAWWFYLVVDWRKVSYLSFNLFCLLNWD
jgi:hypothetical protein